MPLKIVNEDKMNYPGSIRKSDIKELVKCYRNNTGKMRKNSGQIEKFDETKDTKHAWFSLAEIKAFLDANDVNINAVDDSRQYGIRIYFGMHHEENKFQPTPSRDDIPLSDFHLKDTTILVLTKKNGDRNDDQLNDKNAISISPMPTTEDNGQGLDNARICPPECIKDEVTL